MYEKQLPWVNPTTGRKIECEDCGHAPDAPMIKWEIWQSIAGGQKTLLCIGCVETRLGRSLISADLTSCVMNGALLYFMEKYCV